MNYLQIREIYHILTQIALEHGETITYDNLRNQVQSNTNTDLPYEMFFVYLGEVNIRLKAFTDNINKLPMLTALVVNSTHLPGSGFFKLAEDLKYSVNDQRQFWEEQKKAVYKVELWPHEDDLWP